MTDATDYLFVQRRLWVPRLCNQCWRLLWFVVAYVRLRPKYQAIQVLCQNCGDEKLI